MNENLQNFLEKYYKKEESTIKTIEEKILKQKERENISLADYYFFQIKKEIKNILVNFYSEIDINEDDFNLEEPPFYIEGDFCFDCFLLAKKIKKLPKELSEEVAHLINEDKEKIFIEEAGVEGAYVNFKLKKQIYIKILSQIITLKERYGESNINKGQVILIDYSSPNIAKPIGLNHLPSTIIGQVLGNIYNETAAIVIRHNYLGDWGTNFGALMWAYLHWGDDKKIEENSVVELKNLYVRFFEEAEKDKNLLNEARELFNRLENGDLELLKIWEKFRDLSINDFKKVYKRLGVEFDIYLGESYFLAGVDKIIEEAIQKNIAIENKENNLVVVESLKNLPSFLLKKEDGSTLYLTRDLAALKKRFELFNLNLLLYVVGSEQSLHFQQLFALAEALGYLDQKNKKAEHISFGLILIEGKKMATRKGSLIEMNELLNEAVEKSKEIILVKNPEMTADKINEIAEKIGIGSVIYNSLKQSRLQSINFDWNKVLNFEAASAPYLQYSCVRIKSILKKFLDNQLNNEEEINFEKFLKDLKNINFENEVELAVIKKMMFFPIVILRAQKENSPHYICTYLEELAQLFNKFYDSVSVIKTIDEKLKNSRILLIKAVLQVLEKGLNLLNIKIPEEM